MCVKLAPIMFSKNTLPTESTDMWFVLLCFVFQLATSTQVGDSLLMFPHDARKPPSTCETMVFIKLPRFIRADCDRQITEYFFQTWPIIYGREDIAFI